MSAQEVEAQGRRFVEAYNKGKAAFLASVDEGYAADVVIRSIRVSTEKLESN